MSRVTPPVTKFAHALRKISSSANAARPSSLLDSRASRYLPRNLKDLRAECKQRKLNSSGNKAELVDRLAAHDLVGSHGFSTMAGGHRPLSVQSAPVYRTIPMMQGFKSSAPNQAAHDFSTIDFFFFPEIPEPPPRNPFAKLRVPLLPDNYTPNRSPDSGHSLEELDAALPGPEISIVASHPEDVVPATISEVVGNDGLDVDLTQLTEAFSSAIKKEVKEPGVFKELWSGMLDDILGSKGPKVTT
ncbi:hypothetical protein N431DRAFT_452159 [Stipitochalara longipes BDJ]|nr:hypothetical protein N431DRAFT_452159 [Stipitochalara longipes BDJ]